jgi:hypothetical protein
MENAPRRLRQINPRLLAGQHSDPDRRAEAHRRGIIPGRMVQVPLAGQGYRVISGRQVRQHVAEIAAGRVEAD